MEVGRTLMRAVAGTRIGNPSILSAPRRVSKAPDALGLDAICSRYAECVVPTVGNSIGLLMVIAYGRIDTLPKTAQARGDITLTTMLARVHYTASLRSMASAAWYRLVLATVLAMAGKPVSGMDLVWAEGDYTAKGLPAVIGTFPWSDIDLEITGPGIKRLDTSLVNYGQIHLKEGSLEIPKGNVLTNKAGVRIHEGAGIAASSSGTINNSGALVWASPFPEQWPPDPIDVPYWKVSGASLVNAGVLSTSGIVEYTGNGALTFNEGTVFQTDSSAWPYRVGVHRINKPGIVTFNLPYTGFGEGVVELADGTFVAAHPSGFTTTQGFVWSGGQISGSWINARGFKAESGREKVLLGGSIFENQSSFDLMGGTLLIKEGAGFISSYAGTSTPEVLVHDDTTIRVERGAVFGASAGSLRKASGDGDTTILVEGGASFGVYQWPGLGEQQLRVDSGRINIEGSGSLRLNNLHVVGPGRVRMATTGEVFVREGLSIAGAALEIGGGTWLPDSAPLLVRGGVHWTGGTLFNNWKIAEGSTWTITGEGDRRLTGVLENHGTIDVVGPVSLVRPEASDISIVNAGVIRFDSGDVYPFSGAGARIENRSTGRIEILSATTFLSLSSLRGPHIFPYPENQGLIFVGAGGKLILYPFVSSERFENFGEIVVDTGGSIDFGYLTYPGNMTNYGRMSISGTLRGAVINEGFLSVGDSIYLGEWIGSLSLGAAGTLAIDIESMDRFDSLPLSDPAIRGTLLIRSAGYEPIIGESFSVLSSPEGRIHGQFDHVLVEGFEPGIRFDVHYGEHAVTVEVVAVPEPSTFCTVSVGGALVAGRVLRRFRSRRRTACRGLERDHASLGDDQARRSSARSRLI
jgi:hypothetical protein